MSGEPDGPVVCVRCDGDIDLHPHPDCRLTRNELLELDPDAVHDHCYGGGEADA